MPFRSEELSPLEASLGARLLESVSVVVEWVHARPSEDATGPVEQALSLDELSADALARIEALEVAKAQLEGELIEAYGALHTIIGEQFGLRREGYGKAVPISADQVAVKEIAVATGVGEAEVSKRMRLATQVRRHRVVREALRAGQVGLYRATQFVSECTNVDDAAQPGLEQTALEPPRGGVRSQRSFTGRLRRLVKGADTRDASERQAAARRSRTAYGRVGDDGMGSLTLIADAERIAAILARADAVARTARSQGDPRTLEQLRSDFISDTLLFGWPHPPTGCGPAAGREGADFPQTRPADSVVADAEGGDSKGAAEGTPGPDGAGSGGAGPDGAASDGANAHVPRPGWAAPDRGSAGAREGGECGDCGDFDPGRAAGPDPGGDDPPQFAPGFWLGRPPPANAWIVVPFEVAAGLSDAPCELPGHGWVTAEHARAIITAPGSVWHQLSVNVDTGAALHLESRGYRPSAELITQVRARDGVCRGPGCDVPAHRCDLDHEIPWPEGSTRYVDLYAKHRFCHMARTARLWNSAPANDGALRWTTLTGREYLTYPKDWLEALREHQRLAEASSDAAVDGSVTSGEPSDAASAPADGSTGGTSPVEDSVNDEASTTPDDVPPF